MNEVDVIKGAREILAAGRWHKGELHDGKGNYCIYGAVREVWEVSEMTNGYSMDDVASADRAVELLLAHVPSNYAILLGFALVNYNDDPNTVLQDMLDLCDKTLADLGAL